MSSIIRLRRPVVLLDPLVSENLYDDLYRPIEQRRDGVRIVSNEYDDAGNQTATVDAESHRVEYAYNSRNLLEKTSFIDGVDNFYAEQFYDGVGNVVSAFNEARQETVTTYDNENRKRTVTFAGETSENLYDEVGNLTEAFKPKRNSRVMNYDGLNRLETVGEGNLTTAYTYDANGNLRSEVLLDPWVHKICGVSCPGGFNVIERFSECLRLHNKFHPASGPVAPGSRSHCR